MKKIFFLLILWGGFVITTFANNVTLTVEGGNTKNVFYGEETTIVANTTFSTGCTSTGIIWSKLEGSFPFTYMTTIGTGPTYTFNPIISQNITVNANCSGENISTFVFINIKNPEVSVGSGTSYNSGDTVNLSGSIIGTPCTTFDYNWEQISGQTVQISASGQTLVNSNIYNLANFIFPNTNDEIKLKLNVTPKSCFHAGNTYSGTVIYTKKIDSGGSGENLISSGENLTSSGENLTSSGENLTSSGEKRKSYSSKIQDEANNIFYDTLSISKISLNLKLYKQEYSPFMNFNWNNIGGEGQIYYVLEYSTGSNFDKYQTFETTATNYNFIENSLDKNSFIHYFRIKARYLGKYSEYSNVYKYFTNDYLKIECKNCNKNISFENIFKTYDFLLEKYYKTICPKCKFTNTY